jgi:hypothetical protein
MDFTPLLIVAYFVFLAIALRKRGSNIEGPWLFFFRAFFPNWKFYHGINLTPRLYVRGLSQAGNWSDWCLVYPRIPFKPLHLLHNPAVNLALTHQNLVDHLASDINDLADGADIGQKVSYQLVSRLAQQAIKGGQWGTHPMMDGAPVKDLSDFQFEIRMEMPGSQISQRMLQSPEIRP